MIDTVVFWGASGQAKVLRELLHPHRVRVIAVFDNVSGVPSPWPDVPIFYGRAGFDLWRQRQTTVEGIGCLVAIGGNRGADRISLQREMVAVGLTPLIALHKTAFVASSAQLGRGSQILAHAAVAVEALIGEACIVNTGATVDHECRLGDGVHICPGAHLAGLVTIGDFAMVGTGAVVLPRLHIGKGATVGAGAVVTRDVPRVSASSEIRHGRS